MALGKRAKTLNSDQEQVALDTLSRPARNQSRNLVIFLLSVKGGLRAKEIALLTWRMVLDPSGAVGTEMHLENSASKGKKGGRIIPLNHFLRQALCDLLATLPKAPKPDQPVIKSGKSTTNTGEPMSPQSISEWFADFYAELGFSGCSSHSGRRTFITRAARGITQVGGSLRDVQLLAGHSSLSTTQIYIEGQTDAQKKIVDLV